MISSISFRRFRALRDAQVVLQPFNLVIGPNGSGKTSLIDALNRLRWLARLPLRPGPLLGERTEDEGPEIEFHFDSPFEALTARLACVSDRQCDLLEVLPAPDAPWPELRGQLLDIRSYLLDHRTIAAPSQARESAEISAAGGNVASVLQRWQQEHPVEFSSWLSDFRRFFPEYDSVEVRTAANGLLELYAHLQGEDTWVAAEHLSQGTLYVVALLTLVHQPKPPTVLCVEEVDRGIHPRLLRQVRDCLYRLSHPASQHLARPATQVIATTHSPLVLDLFREHPEEIVISSKRGAAAHFERLVDHPLYEQILSTEGSLGDLWYSGLFGGVPQDPDHGL